MKICSIIVSTVKMPGNAVNDKTHGQRFFVLPVSFFVQKQEEVSCE